LTIRPAIARALRERCGLDGRLQDPHLAVAKGAALFALMRKIKVSLSDGEPGAPMDGQVQEVADQLGMPAEQVEAIARKRVATVVPRAFGIKVVDTDDPLWKTDRAKARRYISHLLTANTPLPADTEPETFYTVDDNQSTVLLEVWEQAGSIASEEQEHNTHIGEGMLRDLPPRPAGAPFKVVFHLTETGLLQVHGYEAGSGAEVRFEIQIGGLDEAGTREAATKVAGYDVSG
jgi:molecular chaperone DnaK (HSP70)